MRRRFYTQDGEERPEAAEAFLWIGERGGQRGRAGAAEAFLWIGERGGQRGRAGAAEAFLWIGEREGRWRSFAGTEQPWCSSARWWWGGEQPTAAAKQAQPGVHKRGCLPGRVLRADVFAVNHHRIGFKVRRGHGGRWQRRTLASA